MCNINAKALLVLIRSTYGISSLD